MVGGRLHGWGSCGRGARNVSALLAASYSTVDCVSAAVGYGSVLTHCWVF